jgi:cytochrome P450
MNDVVGSFADPAVWANPWPTFDVMRASSPAFRSEELGMVVVTGYDEVLEVLRDTDRFRNKGALTLPGGKPQPGVREVLAQGYPFVDTLMNTDGERHAHHAGAIKAYLTATRVRKLTEPIQRMTDELLELLPIDSPFEFTDSFSLPLTINVLCEFTGIPRTCSDLVRRGTDAEIAMLGALGSEEENIENARVSVEMQRVLGELIASRRVNPTEDLISHLVHFPPPAGREPLTDAELVSILRGVVIGGNETTRSLINAAVYQLAMDGPLLARLREDEEAFDSFVEESLRHTSPVIMLFRRATRDTELAGTHISAGEIVAVSYGAANHDEKQFTCPHVLDADRPNPRKHLAFGFGTHHCVGSPLGRLEGKIALRSIVDRFGKIELVEGEEPRWYPSFMVRNMASLPIRVHTSDV